MNSLINNPLKGFGIGVSCCLLYQVIKNLFNTETFCKKNEERHELTNLNYKDLKPSNSLKSKRANDNSINNNKNQLKQLTKNSKFLHSSSSLTSSSSSLSMIKTSKNLNNLSHGTTKCVNSVNDSGVEMNIFSIINKKALSETSLNSNNNYISNVRSSSSRTSLSPVPRASIRKSESESALKDLILTNSSYNGSVDNINYEEKLIFNYTSNFNLI